MHTNSQLFGAHRITSQLELLIIKAVTILSKGKINIAKRKVCPFQGVLASFPPCKNNYCCLGFLEGAVHRNCKLTPSKLLSLGENGWCDSVGNI
jgi:hypothetical protein